VRNLHIDDLFILQEWSQDLQLTGEEAEQIRLSVFDQKNKWNEFQSAKLHWQINRTVAYSNSSLEHLLQHRSRMEAYRHKYA